MALKDRRQAASPSAVSTPLNTLCFMSLMLLGLLSLLLTLHTSEWHAVIASRNVSTDQKRLHSLAKQHSKVRSSRRKPHSSTKSSRIEDSLNVANNVISNISMIEEDNDDASIGIDEIPLLLLNRLNKTGLGWRERSVFDGAISRGYNFPTLNAPIPKPDTLPDDPDVVLLYVDEEPADGMSGVKVQPPIYPVKPNHPIRKTARKQHESAAELAIVVPTGPRMMFSVRSKWIPHYFHIRGKCGQHLCFLRHEKPRNGDSFKEWLESLAQFCDADDRCAGFDVEGCLLSAVTMNECNTHESPMPASPSAAAVMLANAHDNRPVDAGIYSKRPLLLLPQPRWVDVYTGATGVIDPAWAEIDPSATKTPIPANHTRFWVVPRGDIYRHDIGEASNEPPGVSRLQHEAISCVSLKNCTGFHHPSGWMKHNVDITNIVLPTAADGEFYSRVPLPPMDYVVPTVISLLREISGMPSNDDENSDFEPTCNVDHVNDDDVVISPDGQSIPRANRLLGRTHLYVVDTSPAFMNIHPSGGIYNGTRGETHPDYWYAGFTYLRRRFGHLPCVSFVSAHACPRLFEENQPKHGRGEPLWHPDNRKHPKTSRNTPSQTLDFVVALRYAAGHSPRAHLLVWEDDSFACTGVTSLLSHTMSLLNVFDERWGGLRVGNGGSGVLFRREIVRNLIVYLLSRRGSENVDVSMWRFLHSGGWADYITKRSWAAHRGLLSSVRFAGGKPTWKRVECSNALDRHWGYYGACDTSTWKSVVVEPGVGVESGVGVGVELGYASRAVEIEPEADVYGLQQFSADWDCNTKYGPGALAE